MGYLSVIALHQFFTDIKSHRLGGTESSQPQHPGGSYHKYSDDRTVILQDQALSKEIQAWEKLAIESKTGDLFFGERGKEILKEADVCFREEYGMRDSTESASWRDDFFKQEGKMRRCAVFDRDAKVTSPRESQQGRNSPNWAEKWTNRHSEGRGSGQSVRARMWITTEDSILEARPRGSYCSPDERWLKLVQGAELTPLTISEICRIIHMSPAGGLSVCITDC